MNKQFLKLLRDNDFDYCESCREYIYQENFDGAFGCPLCKSDSNIITFYVGDEK